MYFFFQPIVIVAAFIFAGVGFYSFSPNVFDTEFCCKENHNVEGKGFKLYLYNAYIYKQPIFEKLCNHDKVD